MKGNTHCCLNVFITGLLIIKSTVSVSVAQEQVELTLPRAVANTVEWHPRISQAISQLQQQSQQITVARAGYYPEVSLGVRSGYDNAYPDSEFSQALVLSVSQMLYDFGKVASEVKVSNALVAQEKANLLLTIDQVIQEVMQAMIEVQRYQQLEQIARLQLVGLQKVAALAQERFDKGATTLSEVVQSDSRVEGARSTLLQYQAQLSRWRGTLAMLMGKAKIPSVSESFPDQPGTCDPDASLQTTPGVLVAQAQKQEAQARIDQTDTLLLPEITLDPSATHYIDNNPMAGIGRDKTQYAVAVNFSMPLDRGGAVKARQRGATIALTGAQSLIRQAMLTAKQQLLEGNNQQVSLQQNLDVLSRREELSKETRDLYRQQYLSLGTRPLLDLLNAEQEIHQAAMARQNTISDLRKLQTQCLYHSGRLRQLFGVEGKVIQGVEIRP